MAAGVGPLVDLWDEMGLPRAVRSAWAPLVSPVSGETVGDGQPGLPAFQLEVARPFFALPASKGFLLARAQPCWHST